MILRQQKDDECIYRKLFIPWQICTGPGLMFSEKDIENARKIGTSTFLREFEGKYLGHIGNVLNSEDVDKCVVDYNMEQINPFTAKSCGIDPAFGSSKFSCVITELVEESNGKQMVRVLVAKQSERPDFNQVLDEVWQLLSKLPASESVHRWGKSRSSFGFEI